MSNGLPKLCILYGEAIWVPVRLGTNMAFGNQQEQLSKRKFISRGTHKQLRNTFPIIMTVQIALPQILVTF